LRGLLLRGRRERKEEIRRGKREERRGVAKVCRGEGKSTSPISNSCICIRH